MFTRIQRLTFFTSICLQVHGNVCVETHFYRTQCIVACMKCCWCVRSCISIYIDEKRNLLDGYCGLQNSVCVYVWRMLLHGKNTINSHTWRVMVRRESLGWRLQEWWWYRWWNDGMVVMTLSSVWRYVPCRISGGSPSFVLALLLLVLLLHNK